MDSFALHDYNAEIGRGAGREQQLSEEPREDVGGPGKTDADRCVLLFEHFRDGMKAEDLLVGAGFQTHSGSPPPEVRTGCDLAVSIPSGELPAAENLLKKNGISVMDVILRFSGELRELQISQLVKKTDFGEYEMVRVGNMKLTFSKKDGSIANISGGGCPDIPLLAIELVGRKLEDAIPPAQIGTTLCAYTLQKAFEYALRDWLVLK